MVHTLPDYTTKYKMASIFGNIDTGELAARLGSIVTFDRRGNVMWLDDFENNINNWNLSYTGAGATTLTNAKSRSGCTSMRMDCGTTSDDMNQADYYIPFRDVTKTGFEISFCVTSTADLNSLRFWIYWYDGSKVRYGQLMYWDLKLGYRNAAGGHTSFATVPNPVSTTSLFHVLKIVIDPTDYTYERVILDNKQYDLSAIAMQSANDATVPCIRVGFNIQNGSTTEHQDMYVDNVIITDNEP